MAKVHCLGPNIRKLRNGAAEDFAFFNCMYVGLSHIIRVFHGIELEYFENEAPNFWYPDNFAPKFEPSLQNPPGDHQVATDSQASSDSHHDIHGTLNSALIILHLIIH